MLMKCVRNLQRRRKCKASNRYGILTAFFMDDAVKQNQAWMFGPFRYNVGGLAGDAIKALSDNQWRNLHLLPKNSLQKKSTKYNTLVLKHELEQQKRV